MSDCDKMRQEFEAWAKLDGFDLSRLKLNNFDSSDYRSSHTSAAEDGFEAGYQAGRKAEREAFVNKLRSEIDHAALNAMRLTPMFGQSKGDLAVRVSTLEAIIENREGEQ
jgi:hypothetical protein